MKQVTHFTEKPKEIYFENFSGLAPNKVWLRRNIKKQTVTPEQGDAYTEYVADEVYFETSHTLDEVQADKDTYWTYGESWKSGDHDVDVMDNEELTKTCTDLQNGQIDLYDAIAALYAAAARWIRFPRSSAPPLSLPKPRSVSAPTSTASY